MELLLIINSCRLASAESVTVITPYFPYSKVSEGFTALHCTVLYCTVLYCTVLYCTV